MPNSITLLQVPNIPIGELANLSPDQLLSLQKQAEENLQKAKRLKDWLDGAISLKYRDIFLNLRRSANKDTGTLHFADGNHKITSVLAKKVEWDQQKLKDVVLTIKKNGDKPEEYVDTSYKVSEAKYNAWPEHIKNIFKPARIFKLGKEDFKIALESKEVDHV